MLGGQPNHFWYFCFPLELHANGPDQTLDLLSSLIACGVGGGPQTLGRFQLKDLSIDERVRA